MDKDRNTNLYKTYYQEMYDYIKDKVKTPEQAVEATQETFEEIFRQPETSQSTEEFLELAKTIADIKSKEQRWKNSKRRLGKLGVAFCIIGFIAMLCSASFLQYMDMIPGNGYQDPEVNFCLQEIFKVSRSNSALNFMDSGDALSVYQYTGIGDISLIKDGAMNWIEPHEKFYVAMIQAYNEEDVTHIINLMKEKIKPEEWSWRDVSIEDFEFYVNGDFILVTYVDPELVESGNKPSVKEMRKSFDRAIRSRNTKTLFQKDIE